MPASANRTPWARATRCAARSRVVASRSSSSLGESGRAGETGRAQARARLGDVARHQCARGGVAVVARALAGRVERHPRSAGSRTQAGSVATAPQFSGTQLEPVQRHAPAELHVPCDCPLQEPRAVQRGVMRLEHPPLPASSVVHWLSLRVGQAPFPLQARPASGEPAPGARLASPASTGPCTLASRGSDASGDEETAPQPTNACSRRPTMHFIAPT